MKDYPLLLDFRGTLFGRGFVVEVSAHGRLLAVQEAAEEWWLYGVNPGAIAVSGESLQGAHTDFREALKAVLIQFVEEAPSFEVFTTEVERFFRATNEPTAVEWGEAVKRVRANQERLEDLPVKSADEIPVSVTVRLKETLSLTPADNIMYADTALAKAA